MSNFAERLAARSAGRPVGGGLTLLSPRPVSRFEPVPAMEVEETVAAASGASDEPDSLASSHTRPANGAPPMEPEGRVFQPAPSARAIQTFAGPPKDEIAGATGANHPSPQPDRATRTPDLLAREDTASAPPSIGNPTATRLKPDVLRVEARPVAVHTRDVQPDADAVAAALLQRNIDRDHEIDAAKREPATAQPALPPLPVEATERLTELRAVATAARTVTGEKSAQPPVPVVSIGKIEVQFLPQAQHVAPPQPQRTRGFDAYARARRGEPR